MTRLAWWIDLGPSVEGGTAKGRAGRTALQWRRKRDGDPTLSVPASI